MVEKPTHTVLRKVILCDDDIVAGITTFYYNSVPDVDLYEGGAACHHDDVTLTLVQLLTSFVES